MDGVWQWRVTNNLIVCGYYFGGWTADGWCVGSYKQIGTFKLQLSKLLPLLDHSTKHPQIIAPGSSPGPSKNHGWVGWSGVVDVDGWCGIWWLD